MSDESQKSADDTDPATKSRLARLAPFLDVAGAVLIFGSWILSHALSVQAQDRANTHQAVVDQVRQFRLYDDFARRITSIQSDLIRTRSLVERVADPGDFSSQPDQLTWTGMTESQILELNDFIAALIRYAGQLSDTGLITQTIEAEEVDAGTIASAFRAARAEFERLNEQSQQDLSDEQIIVLATDIENLRRHVDTLWQDYAEAKQRLLDSGEELLQTAAEQSDVASRHARQCKYLSYVLYIVGTLIILYGRVHSILGADREETA